MRIASFRNVLLVLLLTTATALAAGCGSDDGGSSKPSGAERSADKQQVDDAGEVAGMPAPIEAKLEIEMTKVASKDFAGIPIPKAVKCTKSSPATCSGTVTCPAADDAGPTGFRICAWLAMEGRAALTSRDEPGQACTMQYGGPELATVVGTLDGEKIDASFSRQDGCAINRWDLAAPLWTGEVPPSDPTAGAGDGGAASGSCLALPPDAPVSSEQPAPADSAADVECAVPATPTPGTGAGSTPSTPPMEPEIISDPPEAFEN